MRISDWSSDVCSSDLDPLLLARDDEEGEDRNHRAVHRHADRHLVERDAVEQYLHILDAVDRDPRLADVADDAPMVAVIAAVRSEERRVGKECVSTCRSRWCPDP